jgi:hypothetical protein
MGLGQQFWNFGASYDIDGNTRLLSQVVTGRTRMGYADPDLWVDTQLAPPICSLRASWGPTG